MNVVDQDTRDEVFEALGDGHPLRKASADVGFVAVVAGLLGSDGARERFINADEDNVVLGLDGSTLVRIESGFRERQATAEVTFFPLGSVDVQIDYFDWEIDLTVRPSHENLAVVRVSTDQFEETVTVSAVPEREQPGLSWAKRLIEAKTGA